MEKLSFSGYTMYFRWRHVSHSTRILLFDFDDNFRRYSLWVCPFNHSILVEWHHRPLSKVYGVPTEG